MFKNKQYSLLIALLVFILLAGLSCNFKKEEKEEKLSVEEILGDDVFIRDQEDIDIDEDGEVETIVLYVENSEVIEDEDLYCGNISGEKLIGTFYLGLIEDNKLKSKIELLIEALENGGEFGEKKIIKPQDLNGDNKETEFAFTTYASCNGDYVEIVGYNQAKKELERFKFYREDQILEELFISYVMLFGLVYEDGHLIQEYYTVTPPYGLFHNYYKWSEEKWGFDFVKNIQVESME